MKTHDKKGNPLASSVPDQFLTAYIEAALWSSTYQTEEDGENFPMDDGEHELAPETEDAMLHDCADFFAYCEEIGIDPIPEYDCPQYGNAEKSGHDFWLTRNRHGVGYWDRGLGDVGHNLTEAAHTFGSADLYVGDDGLIYQMGREPTVPDTAPSPAPEGLRAFCGYLRDQLIPDFHAAEMESTARDFEECLHWIDGLAAHVSTLAETLSQYKPDTDDHRKIQEAMDTLHG